MQTVLIKRPFFYPDIEVQTNNPGFAEQLNQMYRTFVSPGGADGALKVRVEFDETIATLTYEGRVLVTDNPLQEVCGILFDNIHTPDDIFAMHAAAVAFQGKAVLMTAPTGTGKTTLTAYLVHQGFEYISDDCVLIDRADLSVLGYPHDIHLREGGMEVLNAHGIYPQGAERVTLGSVDRFYYCPANSLSERVEPGCILFIQRGGENVCREVTAAERMMELMKSPMTPYPVNRDYLEFLRRLAAVPCKRLVYRDMAYIAGLIKEILS